MPASIPKPFPGQLVLGHRGSPRKAVENTLRSFDLAIRDGADGVELDVRRTRDGVPTVIHDDSLQRTMEVEGIVSNLHWGAVQRISGARVPSLEMAVAWAAASGAWLNIELKADDVEEAVLALVDRAGVRDRTVISSFDAHRVRRTGELDPTIRRFFLTDRWDDEARHGLDMARAEGVCLRVDASSPAALADISGLNLPIVVWTVNEAADMRRLLEAGVAAIITDIPELGVRVRDELRRRGQNDNDLDR